MTTNIAIADFYLKYEHRKANLIIYVSKVHVFDADSVQKASLKFSLVPGKLSKFTTRKIRHRGTIYFHYDESLIFKQLDSAQLGMMGLVVKLISHHSVGRSTEIARNYQSLENVDLTALVSRNKLYLAADRLDYSERCTKCEKHARNTKEAMSREPPEIALSFRFHSSQSRLDVYIHRVKRINLFVSTGYIRASFSGAGSDEISSSTSDKFQFGDDDLVHISLLLDTKDVDLYESSVCVQVIALRRSDVQSSTFQFRSGSSVLHAIFGLDKNTSESARSSWSSFVNGDTDLNNRWHKLHVVGQESSGSN